MAMTMINNEIELARVFANPGQPRKEFDQPALEELAASISEYGVLEPIVLTPRGDRYMIIAGERRFRASHLAGKKTIPARIMEADDALVEELALLENVQRQDLNIIEEGMAYKALLDRGMTAKELAAKIGYKITYRIDIRVSLLNLTPELRKSAVSGDLSASQAYEISRLPATRQVLASEKVLRGELRTINKLRSYVNAVIAMENQEAFFELEALSAEEQKPVETLKRLVDSVEKMLRELSGPEASKALRKAAVHTRVTPERLDLIINQLQGVRLEVLKGAGVKQAMAVVT